MDIGGLVQRMMTNGDLFEITRNPLAQFGPRNRTLVGATLLPEQNVEENAYREDKIIYRTRIANGGTRYSPVQKKGGVLSGWFDVRLAEADIGSEFTSRDYDALLRLLNNNASMDAEVQITRWLDTTINQALAELLEVWRWQCIVNAHVRIRGDNGYKDDVYYSNPTGHRVTLGTSWTDDSVDPLDDMWAIVSLLADKGFKVGRILSGTQQMRVLAGNAKIKARSGIAVVDANGQIKGALGMATFDNVNNIMSQNGLPAIERYDLKYRTQTGTDFFLPRDAMVFVCETGRDQSIDLGDSTTDILPNTLGYTAIGRAAGQSQPGRVIRMEHYENKPPRIEAEGWMTALPVVMEPEAIAVISGIG